MKISLKIFLVFSLFLFSCSKDKTVQEPRKYYEGMAYFELIDSATLSESFVMLNGLGLNEFKLNGFKYTVESTIDSLTYFFQILDNKQYLEVFNVLYEEDLVIFRDLGFEHFTNVYLTDWEDLIQNHDITEVFNSRKYGYVYFPMGEEEYWIDLLNKSDLIKSADYWYVYEPWCKTGQ